MDRGALWATVHRVAEWHDQGTDYIHMGLWKLASWMNKKKNRKRYYIVSIAKRNKNGELSGEKYIHS